MLVKINSVSFFGIEVSPVCVEVNVYNRGLPNFDIVGLPDKAVDESRHRVKAAISNSALEFPDKKITINLAPADVHKEGALYDLPIAAGILLSQLKNVKNNRDSCINLEDCLVMGEVSLDGTLRHTRGALLVAMFAKEKNIKNLFIPATCVNEVMPVEGLTVYPVENLVSLLNHFAGRLLISPVLTSMNRLNASLDKSSCADNSDIFNSIVGQEQVKRAITICAAGGHNLLMMGPPGSGKTLLAKALATMLPPLSLEESLEVTKIYSCIGKISSDVGLLFERPFRSPHHTISYSGMIGGGSNPSPGEITLAHRGVLFMDEINEFNRQVLEALRQPLEDRCITISRSRGSTKFPSNFMLVAASNPCPCGLYGLDSHSCKCSDKQIENYQKKLSGPLLDRIDLHVKVHRVENTKLTNSLLMEKYNSDSFSAVKESIFKARNIQRIRFENDLILLNSEIPNNLIMKYAPLDTSARDLLSLAAGKFNFSARTFFKLIKIARTIADLETSEIINSMHMAEAIQYRTQL